MGRSFIYTVVWITLLAMGWLLFRQPSTAKADAASGNVVFLPLVINDAVQAESPSTGGDMLTLDQFIDQVRSGHGDWSGVYVTEKFAYTIVQQPVNKYEFVSSQPKEVTQFMLTDPQVVGLLAHNHLAGQAFFDLETGDTVYLVSGIGEIRKYQVADSVSMRVISPNSSTTLYEDLENGELLDAAKVFSRFYMGESQLTFQTCIQYNGNSSWGRLFITAIPVDAEYTE